MNIGIKRALKFPAPHYKIIIKGEEIDLENGQSDETMKDAIFDKFKGEQEIPLKMSNISLFTIRTTFGVQNHLHY